MDEVRVKAVVLRDAGNRRAGLSALLDYLGLEGFGIGSALWLHGKTRLKARNGVGVRKVSWPDAYVVCWEPLYLRVEHRTHRGHDHQQLVTKLMFTRPFA